MEISNDDLARILGRMEAKLDAQVAMGIRTETALVNLDNKLSTQIGELDARVNRRLDTQEERLRKLEIANPEQIAEDVKDHEERLQALEKGAAKSGAVAGALSSLGVGVVAEILRRKLGL